MFRKFAAAFVLSLVSLVSFTSCGERDYPYVSNICGRWVLYSVNGMPVTDYEQDSFKFNKGGDHGDGVYGFFYPAPTPEGYNWSENRIYWSLQFDYGRNYLIVDTWNGNQWIYQFAFDGWGFLELYDTYNGNTLVYKRMDIVM